MVARHPEPQWLDDHSVSQFGGKVPGPREFSISSQGFSLLILDTLH